MRWRPVVLTRGYVECTMALPLLSVSTRISPSRVVSTIPAYSFFMLDFDICQVVGVCRQTRSFSCRSKALKGSTARASPTFLTFGAPAATASSNVARKASSLLPIVPNASASMTLLRRGSIKYQHQPLFGDINLVKRFGLWTLL